MNRHIRMLVFIAAGVSLPLLIAFKSYYRPHSSGPVLQTAVDITDNVGQDNGSEDLTGAQTVDTVNEESLLPKSETDDDNLKRKQVKQLVEDALAYVAKNPFDQAMNAFTHSRDFIRGELYIFVYNLLGIEEANGQDEHYVWKDLSNQQDIFGTYIVKEILKKAQEGGGWVTYHWRNSTKNSYVKLFTKDGKQYVIGAGYYPHSKRDVVTGLVRAAVVYFNDVVHTKGFPVDEVFSTLSYPAGRFVSGDLYLYAVSFDGQMMANGDRPGLIGTNVIEVKDNNGKFVNREIINKLKESKEGIWIDYASKNTRKLTYAQKVTDKEGKNYFIASGYYPESTPNKAVDLAKDAYEFLKKHGLSAAVNEFSTRQADTYRFGDLYVNVWDLKGRVIANGNNLDAIGINQYDLKDEDGKFYVREIIEKARKGGGWVDFKMKNAFQSMYVEKVELGSDSFVVGVGLYPISKRETALLLARSAAGYMRTHAEEESYSEFVNPNGKFIRGDLYVFVVDFDGIVKVWGDSHELIWRNILNAKDDNGTPYIQYFINTVKQGEAQVAYKINGFERLALLEMVEKNGHSYVVGTGYYLN